VVGNAAVDAAGRAGRRVLGRGFARAGGVE
jgi:hypothetical protein